MLGRQFSNLLTTIVPILNNPRLNRLIFSELVRDEDELVAETAIEALSEHAAQGAQVIDTYIWALGNSDGSFDQPARSAADALAKIGPSAQAALPVLKRLGADPEISDSLREAVNLAIAAISPN